MRGLPYCAANLPSPQEGRARSADDLVGAVFPHACPWLDSVDARFLTVEEGDAKAGSFVTRLSEGGVVVVCVARFVAADGDPLGPAELNGFDVATSLDVPAGCLELSLSASQGGVTRRCCLVRWAATTADLDSAEVPG
jgi:hypothetical protein